MATFLAVKYFQPPGVTSSADQRHPVSGQCRPDDSRPRRTSGKLQQDGGGGEQIPTIEAPHDQTCHGLTPMDPLTLFGLFAVAAMLAFYALEDRSDWFILAFAGACLLASLYGFLQGAWPFGLVEAIWSGVATHRWRIRTLAK
jgi:hypothetical protein